MVRHLMTFLTLHRRTPSEPVKSLSTLAAADAAHVVAARVNRFAARVIHIVEERNEHAVMGYRGASDELRR